MMSFNITRGLAMKSVTEFPGYTLSKGLQTKTTLTSEGKSPEEIQTAMGEAFKYEGDKLKHFLNALDVASQNSENLKRVVVMSLAEGENPPNRGVKVEEHYYVPESLILSKPAAPQEDKGRGKGRGGKGRGGPGRGGPGGGKKESPWGLSPEEKAAKKAKGTENKGGKPA
jgi:hypothetical protein